MKRYWAAILTIASFSLFAQSSQAISEYTLKNKEQNNLSINTSKSPVLALTSKEIAAKGKTFTVIVKCATQSGSGVIIENKNNTYTVITNWHVVNAPDEYIVITPDKKEHKVPYSKVKRLPEYDLATVEFTSKIKYAKAKIKKSSKLTEGDNIYITGFPGEIDGIPEKVYSFTNSTINQLLSKGEEGYTLTYNNFGIHGTSGGAVLDEDGYLVGINGQIAYDETTGKSFGRGIPIQTFLAKKNQFEYPFNIISSGTKIDDIPAPSLYPSPEAGDKPNDVIAKYDQALLDNPNDINAYYQRGIIYYESKYYYTARVNFDEVIKRDSQNADAYVYRGLTYYNLEEYQNAISDYTQAIKINPDDADAYYNIGLTYDDLKEDQKALFNYTQAIKINPNYANAYYNRGNTYQKIGEKEKAIADFRKSALIYQKEGKTKDYQDAMERIRELEQWNKPAGNK